MYSSKPRVRVFSLVRKMNPNHSSQMTSRVPKQESGVPSSNRRYTQQQPRAAAAASAQKNGNSSSAKSSVTIEEVPNHAFLENLNNQSCGGQKIDEEKLPVFLIKLWNMIEDPSLQSIIYWDESGGSFHINDPYTFCRNVLPHYFKHNNLNSMIRQLNMYGFRKMTPLSQGGLTRTESDQDHLEFQHPCFIQNRPDLLCQIKRKQSAKEKEEKQVTEQTAQNLEMVMNEMRLMRDKARNMEAKMNSLTKENRDIWDQMTSMRQQHARQQQYFKKLLHFLVSVMQPGLSKRVAKRGVLEIDFGGNNGAGSSAKRPRHNTDDGYRGVCDLLESLQRETQDPSMRRFANNADCGPLISEVTDEFGNSPGARSSDMFSDFPGMPRYSEHSPEPSPRPIISQPSSSANLAAQGGLKDEFKFPGYASKGEQRDPPQSQHYMGSGALTHENVHRSSPAKRDYQGNLTNSSGSSGPVSFKGQPQQPYGQKRAPYKAANRQYPQSQMQQGQYTSNGFQGGSEEMGLPPQISYQMPSQPSSSTSQPQNQLMRIEDQDTHADMCSPLALSPSFDRAISQEMQEYFTGYDSSLDNLRDLMNTSNWDSFGDNLPEDEEEDDTHQHLQHQPQQPLALKNEPESAFHGFDDADGDILAEMVDGGHQNGFDTMDPNYLPISNEEIFPHQPALRTPSPSDIC